eukprot:TRINITY_DN30132_c0_g1_i1.p1 TRINITY_DN30132_c0_g1~~TRINITY_DN30132_c0_g1_i1.p1  ORF type:complete len:452 (+),score=99.60 TRINITY_DN30132_c0_g1_i1:69-1424(+)
MDAAECSPSRTAAPCGYWRLSGAEAADSGRWEVVDVGMPEGLSAGWEGGGGAEGCGDAEEQPRPHRKSARRREAAGERPPSRRAARSRSAACGGAAPERGARRTRRRHKSLQGRSGSPGDSRRYLFESHRALGCPPPQPRHPEGPPASVRLTRDAAGYCAYKLSRRRGRAAALSSAAAAVAVAAAAAAGGDRGEEPRGRLPPRDPGAGSPLSAPSAFSPVPNRSAARSDYLATPQRRPPPHGGSCGRGGVPSCSGALWSAAPTSCSGSPVPAASPSARPAWAASTAEELQGVANRLAPYTASCDHCGQFLWRADKVCPETGLPHGAGGGGAQDEDGADSFALSQTGTPGAEGPRGGWGGGTPPPVYAAGAAPAEHCGSDSGPASPPAAPTRRRRPWGGDSPPAEPVSGGAPATVPAAGPRLTVSSSGRRLVGALRRLQQGLPAGPAAPYSP